MNEQQKERLDLGQNLDDQSVLSAESELNEKQKDQQQSTKTIEDTCYYCNKAICIVSRYPFFEPFRRFLYFLLNTTTMGESAIPIERYISHLVSLIKKYLNIRKNEAFQMFEVPFPSPSRPRILMELGNDMVAFENSDDSQFPLTGANFVDTLKCLGTENLIYAMLLTLLEQKVIIDKCQKFG